MQNCVQCTEEISGVRHSIQRATDRLNQIICNNRSFKQCGINETKCPIALENDRSRISKAIYIHRDIEYVKNKPQQILYHV